MVAVRERGRKLLRACLLLSLSVPLNVDIPRGCICQVIGKESIICRVRIRVRVRGQMMIKSLIPKP